MWTIEQDFNITFRDSADGLEFPEGTVTINKRTEFDAFVGKLTREQLQEWYNSIPGEAPVKRLRNRPTAIDRIWQAMQRLAGVKIPQSVEAPDVDAEAEETQKKARVKKSKSPSKPKIKSKAKKSEKPKTEPKPTKIVKAVKNGGEPRQGSKRQLVISMVSRKGGATMDELTESFGWQKHTVRGLLSTLNSKGVLKTVTSKNSDGHTVYSAA